MNYISDKRKREEAFKMEVEEEFENLIYSLKESGFIKKILKTKNFQKRQKIYQELVESMKSDIDSFYWRVSDVRDIYEYAVDFLEITPENVVEIVWLVLLTGIQENHLIYEYPCIKDELKKVGGEKKHMASVMADMLTKNYWILYYTADDFLKKV